MPRNVLSATEEVEGSVLFLKMFMNIQKMLPKVLMTLNNMNERDCH